MARAERVTIKDVARQAGVSITAVSHALNGKGTISDETRARVRAVADQLGYEADALARGLRRSTMGAVGLVLRSLDTLQDYTPDGVDVFERFVGAVASQALARGLSIMLVPDLSKIPVPPLSYSMDGYIVANPHQDDPVVALLERRQIPYVTYGRDPSRPDFADWASEDDVSSTELVLNHLVAEGARSIVLVVGTDLNAWNADTELTYQRWCRDRDAPVRIYRVPERTGTAGGAIVGEQILDDALPDAVFCLTGRHAAGVLTALAARGIRVPEDVLLAAGSDSEHSRTSQPPISALQMSPTQTAGALLDILRGVIDGTTPHGPVLTEARLVVRASTQRPTS